jgi:hypothetical protein
MILGGLLGVALFIPVAVVLIFAKVVSVVFNWLEDKQE